MALKKLCRCGKKIDYYSKYCDKCLEEVEKENKEKIKSYDKRIRNSTENKMYTRFYNSKAWKILSELIKVKFHGLCVTCEVNRKDTEEVTKSDTTHHIIELKDDWNLRLVEVNLIPLCHNCHNNLHANYTEKEKEKLRIAIKSFKSKF